MTVALVVTLVLLAAALAAAWALWSRQVRTDAALHAERETTAGQRTRIALLERDLADETARAGALSDSWPRSGRRTASWPRRRRARSTTCGTRCRR